MSNAVAKFERAFADWLGVRHAFAFWKGRVAMYAALRAMGIGSGDEIILPGYTCVMDVNPIKYLGATPAFADVEPATYNATPENVERAITPQTKAIVAQHTYGYPCEMDGLLDVAKRHNLPIIEDCCLALGSTYRGKLCGTFGKATYWSFQWNKPFTTGVGGMVTTDDDDLAGEIRKLCQAEMLPVDTKSAAMLACQRAVYRATIWPKTTAIATSLFRWMTRKGLVIGSSSTSEFEPIMPDGFFLAMSSGQARAGLAQMRKIDRNIAHRREMRGVYDELLTTAGWSLPALPDYMDPVLVRYPVRVADKQRAIAEAPGRGIELGTWFECPLHPIETPLELYDYHTGMCPVAERACHEVVNLPTHIRAGRRTAKRGVRFVTDIGSI